MSSTTRSSTRYLTEAREHHLRLVLLWFATWKNGSNHYMPPWMKLDHERYPNIVSREGKEVDSPSPLCEERWRQT